MARNLLVVRHVDRSENVVSVGFKPVDQKETIVALQAKIVALEKQIFSMRCEHERALSASAHFAIKESNLAQKMRDVMFNVEV
jgi:hypothetical protein